MDTREVEARLLRRCALVGTGKSHEAADSREANVFRVAAMVLGANFAVESKRLRAVSGEYFAHHPDERLIPQEVVRKGWVLNLPRLRDGLYRLLPGR